MADRRRGGRYRYFARLHTTTNLTPQDIHELGSCEVARIRAEMEPSNAGRLLGHARRVLPRTCEPTRNSFTSTGEDLLNGLSRESPSGSIRLIEISRKLPRVPYGVHPVPDAIAPTTTTAYASAGARRLAASVFFRQPLQAGNAAEVGDAGAHAARSCARASPADFASPRSSGIFQSSGAMAASPPSSKAGVCMPNRSARTWASTKTTRIRKFGQLTYEMWRAVRLVVDTGIHAMHWDRERAIDYFMENAAKTEHDVTNEIDRYISGPVRRSPTRSAS